MIKATLKKDFLIRNIAGENVLIGCGEQVNFSKMLILNDTATSLVSKLQQKKRCHFRRTGTTSHRRIQRGLRGSPCRCGRTTQTTGGTRRNRNKFVSLETQINADFRR